jgi:hypothetical protein
MKKEISGRTERLLFMLNSKDASWLFGSPGPRCIFSHVSLPRRTNLGTPLPPRVFPDATSCPKLLAGPSPELQTSGAIVTVCLPSPQDRIARKEPASFVIRYAAVGTHQAVAPLVWAAAEAGGAPPPLGSVGCIRSKNLKALAGYVSVDFKVGLVRKGTSGGRTKQGWVAN